MVKGISNRVKTKQFNKFNYVFRCNTCHITRDFIADYFNNTAILRDDDELVHTPKVAT